jgi:hypothetical protein
MHTFDFIIYCLAIAVTVAVYLRDPSLPAVGFRAGGQLLLDVLPRLAAALILTGMLQVMISAESIQHWLGRGSTHRAIFAGFAAGILTPGGPLVSFPIMAVFYKGGASLSALVAYMTSWSSSGSSACSHGSCRSWGRASSSRASSRLSRSRSSRATSCASFTTTSVLVPTLKAELTMSRVLSPGRAGPGRGSASRRHPFSTGLDATRLGPMAKGATALRRPAARSGAIRSISTHARRACATRGAW